MKKFEYTLEYGVFDVKFESLEEKPYDKLHKLYIDYLNDMGSKGWEIITESHDIGDKYIDRDNVITLHCKVFFKKQLS